MPLSPTTGHRAEYPANAELLPNSAGSARGMAFQIGKTKLFAMPGVPREMRTIMIKEVLPRLRDSSDRRLVRFKIQTTGVPESKLYESVHGLFQAHPDLRVAYLPKHTGVTIRLSLESDAVEQANQTLLEIAGEVRNRIPKAVYGYQEAFLSAVVGDLLRQYQLKVTTAESCTGGLIASMLTDVSGSSDYFEAGYVTYANSVKISVLAVPEEILVSEGAVSKATVRFMLTGALKRSGADYAIAVSGVAGPTGGTPEKPVGLVYIGIGRTDDFVVKRFQFGRDRIMNKEMTAMAALNLLRIKLLQDFDND